MSHAGDSPPPAAQSLPRIGSYRLVQALGSGGMSSVFRAVHEETGHEVAVKVLPRSLAKNATMLQRFLREAKSAEALEHPNIVAIYDRGSEGGRYYIVLEYVPGGDLHDRVRDGGPLAVDEAIRALCHIAEGLRYAAGRGVIHRDIKPANLLLAADGHVKITDLGLALQVDDEDERVTRDGTTVGTVDYMAPEQARDSRATSVRSDIYSLGCTLYYMLTGSPPFPGGDVTDKLRRHAQAPAPDVRAVRPEVPEAVARLVRRMMAKRPDDRFGDYDALLAALAPLPGGAPAAAPADAPLTALIDDEDDAPAPAPAPMTALIDDEDDAPSGYGLAGPLMAEIDDEDDLLPEAKPGPRPPARPPSRPSAPARPPSRPAEPAVAADLGFADLAALDDDAGPPAAGRRLKPAASLSAPREELFEVDEPTPAAMPGRSDRSLSSYIARGLAIGLALVIVAVVAFQLAGNSSGPAPEPEGGEGQPGPEAVANNGNGADVAPPDPLPRPPTPAEKRAADAAEAARKKAAEAPAPVAWSEPAEPAPPSWIERDYPAAVLAKYRPDWANAPVPESIPGPFVFVRRVAERPDDVPDLARAFNTSGGTVEMAGDGPFFEHDLRIPGESRLIRARRGVRPIIVIDPPAFDAFRRQTAVFVLDGQDVVLDGLDLVLRTDEFTNQVALFRCLGARLTLRDCTITLVGRRSLAAIEVGEPFGNAGGRASRVRLERTLIRGASATALHLAGDPAEVVFDRSVLLCGGPRAVSVTGRAAGERRINWLRSLSASRGPLLDLDTPPGSAPVVARALGSTFARLAGVGGGDALIEGRDEAIAPRDLLDWAGEDNALAGWSAWLAAGSARSPRVVNSAAARATWPGANLPISEAPAPWPESLDLDELAAADLAERASVRSATLVRVAAPSPWLDQKAFSPFKPLPLAQPSRPPAPAGNPLMPPAPTPKHSPILVAGVTGSVADRPPMPGAAGQKAAQGARLGPSAMPPPPGMNTGAPAAPAGAPGGGLVLDFDAAAEPWKGDLGRFLAEKLAGDALTAANTRKVVVRARGGGGHYLTPIRLAEGLSLEVQVERSADPLTWFPAPGPSADALFDVRGGDLTLTGAWLAAPEDSPIATLVRVEDGRLHLADCRLTTRLGPEPTDRVLVRFRAPGTRPEIGSPEFPACVLTDCILTSGGAGVEAEVGRGVVMLTNCAVACLGDALVLEPQAVRRDRFAADLRLDRCTLVAGRSFVRFGPWPGAAPGPGRPWVVFSTRCAFLDAFERGRGAGGRQAAVLRVDPKAMAQGAVFWQPGGDAYDVSYFAVAGPTNPPPTALGPDVERQWAALWGRPHVTSALTGPGRGNSGPAVRLPRRLVPGKVDDLSALALDPNGPNGRKAPAVGADSARLRLSPPRR